MEAWSVMVGDGVRSVDSADNYLAGHSQRVAAYALTVARALGLSATHQAAVALAAYLHDLGKVRVPLEILHKPGPLTAEEFAVVRRHPIWGAELLARIGLPWRIKMMIRWHHEKCDGSGYPDRLRGAAIPLGAQIISIVDAYDALTSDRGYRPATSTAGAVARLAEARHWWRSDVYSAFLRSVARPAEAA